MRIVRSLLLVTAVLALAAVQVPFGELPPAANAAFPGENGLLTYVSVVTGSGWRIKSIDLATNSVTDITAGMDASWSPDGQRLAVLVETGAEHDVVVVNADGTGLVNLTLDVPERVRDPAWSPDGKEIVYADDSGGVAAMTIMKADGTDKRHIDLSSTLGFIRDPEWSPTDDRIVFAARRIESDKVLDNIYAIDSDGTNLMQLTADTNISNDRGVTDVFPSWSPDGSQIVFQRNTSEDGSSRVEIWKMDADGNGEQMLVGETPERHTYPQWSPDGTKIAVTVDSTHLGVSAVSGMTLLLMNPDGSGGEEVAVTEPVRVLVDWQPRPGPVHSVEFTQAVQDLQVIGALQADVAVEGEPPVPIVEGKPAAMRVYFGEVDETTNYTIEVTGQVSETKSVTLAPGCTVADQRRQDLGCSSVDFFFTPPPGEWSVKLVVKAFGGDTVQDEEFKLTSLDTPGLVVKYLPICVKLTPGAEPTCPSSAVDTTAPNLMRKLFPVAEDELTYGNLPIPRMVLDAPVSTAEEKSGLTASLRLRYELMTFAGGYTTDQLAGWLPAGGTTGLLGISDPVWAGSTGRVSWQVDTSGTDPLDGQFTLAHEIGHNLGLRHVNLADGCGASDNATDWPYADSTIQEAGFDVAAGVAMVETKKDLMSYCSPPGTNIWISPHSYNRLAKNYLQPTSIKAAGAGQAGQFLLVSGVAQADGSGGSIESAYVIASSVAAEPSNPQGNHCLEFSGGQAAEYCFTLEFEDHRSHEPVDSEWFTLRVPLPAGTDRVALTRGTDELTALDATASAPSVTIDEPQAGAEWGGEQTIAWSASDGDGGPMKYAVLYSSDGGNSWLPLAVDAADSEVTFDTGDLEGDEILIRVLASDGLKTTEATTGPVSLAPDVLSGDVDCSGAVNSVDALKLSRQVAGLPVAQTQPCPVIGTGDLLVFGDINCDTHITAVDTLFVLRFVAGMPVNLPQGCRQVGT